MKDRPITRRRADVVREEPPATAIDVATSPIPPPTPPLRVGTTAWRVADPGARLTHEFHLALPCRPVHVGLIIACEGGDRCREIVRACVREGLRVEVNGTDMTGYK